MGFNYIVFEVGGSIPREVPIIYPDFLVHADVAASVTANVEGLKGAKPISAGSLEMATYGCSGRSTTLGLESRGEIDKQLINSFLYCHGM